LRWYLCWGLCLASVGFCLFTQHSAEPQALEHTHHCSANTHLNTHSRIQMHFLFILVFIHIYFVCFFLLLVRFCVFVALRLLITRSLIKSAGGGGWNGLHEKVNSIFTRRLNFSFSPFLDYAKVTGLSTYFNSFLSCAFFTTGGNSVAAKRARTLPLHY